MKRRAAVNRATGGNGGPQRGWGGEGGGGGGADTAHEAWARGGGGLPPWHHLHAAPAGAAGAAGGTAGGTGRTDHRCHRCVWHSCACWFAAPRAAGTPRVHTQLCGGGTQGCSPCHPHQPCPRAPLSRTLMQPSPHHQPSASVAAPPRPPQQAPPECSGTARRPWGKKDTLHFNTALLAAARSVREAMQTAADAPLPPPVRVDVVRWSRATPALTTCRHSWAARKAVPKIRVVYRVGTQDAVTGAWQPALPAAATQELRRQWVQGTPWSSSKSQLPHPTMSVLSRREALWAGHSALCGGRGVLEAARVGRLALQVCVPRPPAWAPGTPLPPPLRPPSFCATAGGSPPRAGRGTGSTAAAPATGCTAGRSAPLRWCCGAACVECGGTRPAVQPPAVQRDGRSRHGTRCLWHVAADGCRVTGCAGAVQVRYPPPLPVASLYLPLPPPPLHVHTAAAAQPVRGAGAGVAAGAGRLGVVQPLGAAGVCETHAQKWRVAVGEVTACSQQCGRWVPCTTRACAGVWVIHHARVVCRRRSRWCAVGGAAVHCGSTRPALCRAGAAAAAAYRL